MKKVISLLLVLVMLLTLCACTNQQTTTSKESVDQAETVEKEESIDIAETLAACEWKNIYSLFDNTMVFYSDGTGDEAGAYTTWTIEGQTVTVETEDNSVLGNTTKRVAKYEVVADGDFIKLVSQNRHNGLYVPEDKYEEARTTMNIFNDEVFVEVVKNDGTVERISGADIAYIDSYNQDKFYDEYANAQVTVIAEITRIDSPIVELGNRWSVEFGIFEDLTGFDLGDIVKITGKIKSSHIRVSVQGDPSSIELYTGK